MRSLFNYNYRTSFDYSVPQAKIWMVPNQIEYISVPVSVSFALVISCQMFIFQSQLEQRNRTAMTDVLVSVVIPVMNEESNILPLAHEIESALGTRDWNWECVWIDDGSSDRSLEIIKALALDNPCHRYISFEKNAGQSAAFTAGFSYARGIYIATIDGDGQNDPADIPALVDLLLAGRADMVNGYRGKRRDNLLRIIASRIANGVRNALTGKTVRDVGCSTRAFRRECVELLPAFKGMHRFLPTLVALYGFSLDEVAVNHRPRTRGRSKYSINNRLWVGILDIIGVMWLRKRAFRYRISKNSSGH